MTMSKKNKMDVHYSSNDGGWETPKKFYTWIDSVVGGFVLDAAATQKNRMTERYYDESTDGLKKPWESTTWCNPPYGRKIGQWTRKAASESGSKRRIRSVLLVPARTDTKWFQEAIKKAEHALFLKGRLKFSLDGMEQDAAPFPSAVLFFGVGLTRDQRSQLKEKGFLI